MDNELIVIEFAGVPYAGKTETMRALSGLMQNRGIRFEQMQEYQGPDDFYARMKPTAAINYVRLLEFLRRLTEIATEPRLEYFLVDRGVYDTYTWFKLFESRNELPKHMGSIISPAIEALEFYSAKRRVVWMDKDPTESLRIHRGGRQGRIVNESNLTQLSNLYSLSREDLKDTFSFHQIDSNHTTASHVAESLMRTLKIS